MEAIIQFIQTILTNIDFANLSVGMLIGVALIAAFAVWTPNKLAHDLCYKAGKKLSARGRKAVGKQWWESIENNLTGTVVAAAKGLQDGADSDDADADDDSEGD